MEYEKTRELLEAFEREGLVYAIFGAVALNLHGLARATQDLDIFVSPTEENISRLRSALRSVFDDPHIEEITADDLLGDYPAVQYVPPEGRYFIYILTRLGAAVTFDDLETERIHFDGIEVTIVTARLLHRRKRSTVRPQGWADAYRLAEHFTFEDE